MRIALDAMGGENAPREVVRGAVAAAREQGVEVVLVGKRSAIEAELGNHRTKIAIVDASEVVEFADHPAQAIRHKQDSSIVVGMNLLKNGEASAFVSAGSTGAVMAAATLTLKRIKGIERPALGFLFVLPWHSVLLIDVGANADCRPSQLVQFAQMGSVYMERIFGLSRPRIGLLSNGEEETKGNLLVNETHRLLKDTGLNFIGNVEGNDIPRSIADVIVTDGFTGNVVLKTGEGIGEMVLESLHNAVMRRLYTKAIGFTLKRTLRSAIQSLDYAEHGGAPLLGVNGNVIIAHGHSEAKAIKNAVFIAKRSVEQDIVEAIKTGVS
ncbi:MAG TPA: phosphate acyltransferase PlsX [Dehalococcoidia bacterium]|nr:phosphate acyltransferase PlsX [Dehalococcoidia bacterium]